MWWKIIQRDSRMTKTVKATCNTFWLETNIQQSSFTPAPAFPSHSLSAIHAYKKSGEFKRRSKRRKEPTEGNNLTCPAIGACVPRAEADDNYPRQQWRSGIAPSICVSRRAKVWIHLGDVYERLSLHFQQIKGREASATRSDNIRLIPE